MDQHLVAEILTGDSEEIADLKANLPLLEGFIKLSRELDSMSDISKRFYEESRSLYQATCSNHPINDLETILAQFFGPPVKPAGKPLPRKLRKNSTVKYLGGVEKDQSLFLIQLKTGEFYGALWPWRRNKGKVEIHMGYCSDWMVDEHYQQLESLIKRNLSHSAFQQMDTDVGGQIRGIGLPSFLQMAEMEQSSFTLRITSAGRVAQLHVAEGQLLAAETGEWTGRDAAYRIISWDDVTIEIAPADTSKTNEINQPLMHVLMESLKIKDEVTSSSETPPAPPQPRSRVRRPTPDTDKDVKEAKRLVRLERAPTPRAPSKSTRLINLVAIAVGIFVLGASGLVLGLYVLDHRASTDDYASFIEKVGDTDEAGLKISLLQDYLQSHPQSPHTADLHSRIEQIQKGMEDSDFEQITLKISNLPVDEEYEAKAIALYGDFLEKYPDSRFQQRITAAIGDIKKLLDQYYYEELKRAARLDFSQRLRVYKEYLARFPQGRYQQDVDLLINAMGRQHLTYLKTEDAQCEQSQRWEPCIQRHESFIAELKDTPLAGEAQAMLSQLQDKRDLAQLRKLKEAAGNDFLKASTGYQEYLKAHPESTQKKIIEAELAALNKKLLIQRQWNAVQEYAADPRHGLFERIQKLDRYIRDQLSGPYAHEAQELMNRLESQRQATMRQNLVESRKKEEQSRIHQENERRAQQQLQIQKLRSALELELRNSTRYRVNGDGSFTDLTTGLTWCLLDSFQELGGCLNYPSAKKYVQSLTSRGNGHWRLPSASELAGLYKQTPFFPGSGAEWYWTADAYVRGYHSVADVVTSKSETFFQREHRRQDECGAVRAVR